MEGYGPPINDHCPICHENFNVPCQANCSHWFCGQCILRFWAYGSSLQPCKCPMCRRPINLLIPADSAEQRRVDPQVANVLRDLEVYNRRFGERGVDLVQKLRDLPFLLRRLLHDLMVMDPHRSLPFILKLRVYLAMILSFIYLLSPVDLIPEAILGVIGLLDDLFVVLICFLYVAALYRSVLVGRHGGS